MVYLQSHTLVKGPQTFMSFTVAGIHTHRYNNSSPQGPQSSRVLCPTRQKARLPIGQKTRQKRGPLGLELGPCCRYICFGPKVLTHSKQKDKYLLHELRFILKQQ